MNALTREQARRLDRYAIELAGVPGIVLMENAGRNAADAICRFLGDPVGRAVAIVAGAGNNGGDGFVIARHLEMRGAVVATMLVCDVEKITGDARVNLEALRKLGSTVLQLAPHTLAELAEFLADYEVVIDAIGGTGVQGALRGEQATAALQLNASGKPIISIDIPTGLDCDTGEAPGPVVKARMTVTMVAPKRGFSMPSARQYTGEVVVVDIGIPADRIAHAALAES